MSLCGSISTPAIVWRQWLGHFSRRFPSQPPYTISYSSKSPASASCCLLRLLSPLLALLLLGGPSCGGGGCCLPSAAMLPVLALLRSRAVRPADELSAPLPACSSDLSPPTPPLPLPLPLPPPVPAASRPAARCLVASQTLLNSPDRPPLLRSAAASME